MVEHGQPHQYPLFTDFPCPGQVPTPVSSLREAQLHTLCPYRMVGLYQCEISRLTKSSPMKDFTSVLVVLSNEADSLALLDF